MGTAMTRNISTVGGRYFCIFVDNMTSLYPLVPVLSKSRVENIKIGTPTVLLLIGSS